MRKLLAVKRLAVKRLGLPEPGSQRAQQVRPAPPLGSERSQLRGRRCPWRPVGFLPAIAAHARLLRLLLRRRPRPHSLQARSVLQAQAPLRPERALRGLVLLGLVLLERVLLERALLERALLEPVPQPEPARRRVLEQEVSAQQAPEQRAAARRECAVRPGRLAQPCLSEPVRSGSTALPAPAGRRKFRPACRQMCQPVRQSSRAGARRIGACAGRTFAASCNRTSRQRNKPRATRSQTGP